MSAERERSLSKKFAKYDNLRPLSNFILTSLEHHHLPHFKTKKIVGEIIDRIVTAGYNWDKILYYHSKGGSHFNKKLIPYFFMSKDELPSSLGPESLIEKLFGFIERSVNEVSSNMTHSPAQPKQQEQQPQTPKTCLIRRPSSNTGSEKREEEEKREAKKRIVLKRRSKDDSSSSSDSDSDNEMKRRKRKKKMRSRSSSPSSSDDDVVKQKTPSLSRSPSRSLIIKTESKLKEEHQSPASDASSTELDTMMTEPGESSSAGDKSKQKLSLLEKVNDIIKSCVKLKEEKKISGVKLEKANKIIAKAQAKRAKLLKQETEEAEDNNNQEDELKKLNDDEEEILKEDAIIVDDDDAKVKDDEENKEDVEEGEITDDEENNDDVEVTIEEEVKVPEKAEKKKKKKHKKDREEKRRRRSYSEDSHQGTVDDELRAMAGHDNRKTRLILDHERSVSSRSRSPSWSEPEQHSYRRKAAEMASKHSGHMRSHRSRTPSSGSEEEPSDLNRWIPITPCTIIEDAEVEPMSTAVVSIKAKGEFSFKDNPGCFVR